MRWLFTSLTDAELLAAGGAPPPAAAGNGGAAALWNKRWSELAGSACADVAVELAGVTAGSDAHRLFASTVFPAAHESTAANFTGIGTDLRDAVASLFGDGTIAFIPQGLFTRFPALSNELERVAIGISGTAATDPSQYLLPTEATLADAAAAYPLASQVYMSIVADADTVTAVGPDRRCPPRHWMQICPRNQGTKCVV